MNLQNLTNRNLDDQQRFLLLSYVFIIATVVKLLCVILINIEAIL